MKEGANGASATPEYFKLWNNEEVSLNAIKEDPDMAIAFLTLVRIKELVGQMTLDGDVIYQPLPPHEITTSLQLDYSQLEQ